MSGPNPNDDINTKAEDLNEEQTNWYHENNPSEPTPISEPNKEVLIEAVEFQCLNCSISDIHPYEKPITKLEYLADCISKRCPQCKTPYQLNPIEVGFEKSQTKRSAYSMEEWQKLLNERYTSLKTTIANNLPSLWPAMELVLSVKSILYIKNCTLPMIMILLGPPSGLKTASLHMLRKSEDALYVDNFTAKSFVSHNSAVKEEKLKDIDLLPKIKNKLFLTPEMAPIFGKKEEDLREILSLFTKIADGHGLETHSGACGRRGYTGEYMFTMVGVAVDIPRNVFKLLGYLGPKLYFFRLSKLIKNKAELLKALKQDTYQIKVERIEKSLNEYLNTFQMGPFDLVQDKDEEEGQEQKTLLKKMEWDAEKDSTNDNDYSLGVLVDCGRLLARLRAVVPTWGPRSQGYEYEHPIAIIEEPERAIEQLRNIARGHALSQGHNCITKDDLAIPIKVVLSTASIERVNLFDLLLANKGRLTTSRITDSLNISSEVTSRTMTELKAIGLVDFEEKQHVTDETAILLKSEFDWFLIPEFTKLREGFVPTDNREYLKKGKDRDDDTTFRGNLPPRAQTSESGPELAIYECTACGETYGEEGRRTHKCRDNTEEE